MADTRDPDADEQVDRAATVDRFRPTHVLSFTVRGDAHFRRPEGTSTNQTYATPPKTTLAGMLAAMLGYDRDSYYDSFRLENAAIAVVPETPLRSQTMGVSHVDTNENRAMTRIGSEVAKWKRPVIELPNTWESDRDVQREPFAVLFDVVYRIFVGLADDEIMADLRERPMTSITPPRWGGRRTSHISSTMETSMSRRLPRPPRSTR